MAAELEKTTELQRLGKPRIKLNIDENRTSMKANKKSSVLQIRENKVTMEGRTGTNRGTPSMVDITQEIGGRYSTITTKGAHHPRIICYGKGLPSMRQQPANVNTDKAEMDLALPAGEHRPDYDHLPKAIFISSSKPSFSGNVAHHQDNHTLFPAVSKMTCVTG
jgi:hypothetical protein